MTVNERKGNEKLLDTHISRAHLTTWFPALCSSAKSFVPIMSGLGSLVPKGRGEGRLSVACRKRHKARDQGSCPAINYLGDLGQTT
jgi:hypothetical protein